ncbi:MAG: hypothetical protein JNL82_28040 [Myxococcales bacterium]|nr:hypothetical protein [Myxococcales bacterium]
MKSARLIVLMTGFIAFTSIAVAGTLATRLGRARGALAAKLQACACCEDLQPGKTR